MSAIQIWTKVLTSPSVRTFEILVSDPQAGVKRAFTWLFNAAFLPIAIIVLLSVSGRALQSLSQDPVRVLGMLIGTVLGAAIEGALYAVALFIWMGIAHGVARLLGGQGTYGRLVYAYATFMAPFGFAILTISLLVGQATTPTSPLITIGGLVLMVIVGAVLVWSAAATKAVHKLAWGRIVLAVICPYVMIGVLSVILISLTGRGVVNTMQ